MKLSSRPANSVRKQLIYGPPKRGKSRLAGTLSEKLNLHYFDLENGGVESLLEFPTEWQDRVTVYQITDSPQAPVAAETIMRVLEGGERKICEKHGKINCPVCAKDPKAEFQTINISALGPDDVLVIDSGTQLTESFKTVVGKALTDEQKFEFDHWGHLGKLISKIGNLIQAAPCSIVFITHEAEIEMEDGKKMLVPVFGSTSTSRTFAKYFHDVIYCDFKMKNFVAYSTQTSNGLVYAGSRHSSYSLDSLKNRELTLVPFYSEKEIVQHGNQAPNSTSSSGQSSKAATRILGNLAGSPIKLGRNPQSA